MREIGGFGSKTLLFQNVVAGVQLASRFGRIDIFYMKASFRKHGSVSTLAAKVEHWLEDSLYLLDLICELLSECKHRLKEAGLAYFSQFNYNLAKKIKSPIKRQFIYFKLLKTFKLIFIQQVLKRAIHRSLIYPVLRSFKKKLSHDGLDGKS